MSELTPEHQAWRKGKATASKVAAAHTGSYGGMFKAVGVELGRIVEEQTAFMARGDAWELRIADMVHTATGYYVVGEQVMLQRWDNPRHGATIDGLLAGTPEATLADCIANLEVKTKAAHTRTNWPYFKAQTQFQMWCTGLPRVCLAIATIDDTDDTLQRLDIEWHDADPFEQSLLVETADRFLQYVDNEEMPLPDTWHALDYIRANQPKANENADAVPIDEGLAARYHEVKDAEKQIVKERKKLQAQLLDQLGPATNGTADGYSISLSKNQMIVTEERQRTILADHPELGVTILDVDAAKAAGVYEEYREPIGSRRLTVRQK